MYSSNQYRQNAFQQLLNDNKLFNSLNEDEKTQVMNFFVTLKHDFNLDDNGYFTEKIVNSVLGEPSEYTSYSSVFSQIYHSIEKIENFEKFEELLIKYKNVRLDLPFKTSAGKSNLATHLYTKLTSRDVFSRGSKLTCEERLDILKIIVTHLPKSTSMLISNSNAMDLISLDHFDLVMNDDFKMPEITEDMDDGMDDYNNGICQDAMEVIKIFKLLIKNEVYDETKFDKLLTFLYCRCDMMRLEIIKKLKPSLLSINTDQLSKIIFYGRSNALQFVIDNLLDQFNQITSENNPYDILACGTKIDYIHDIWNNWSWHNDECDKPCIGHGDFDEVCKLMSEHSTCVMSDDITQSWLKKIIGIEMSRRKEGLHYFVEKSILISMLSLKHESKDDVKRMVEIVGYDTAWNILKKCNSSILQLLLSEC